MMVTNSFQLVTLGVLLWFNVVNAATLKFSTGSILLESDQVKNVTLKLSGTLPEPAEVVFTYQEGDKPLFHQAKQIIEPLHNLTILANETYQETVSIRPVGAGNLIIGINSTSKHLQKLNESIVRIEIVHSQPLTVVIAIVGWIYFAAWSISFYPQVFLNWRRKSVEGLNFDFLAYNLTGFLAYGVYNVGMYWIPLIFSQYKLQHPHGVNPVQLNDVIFALHAVLLTLITIFQCFIYERHGQRVSRISTVLVCCMWLTIIIGLILSLTNEIKWLTFLMISSYVKLAVTLIKYIPQAYMNYKRKSTIGWSIGNVLLDCTGGSLSILQMFLLSYNNNDWGSIFGDPTKFGLGLFSILFDILFMVQHYVLYRNHQPITHASDDEETRLLDDDEGRDRCV
ncbi:cystinosin homolog isoform X4 [Tubulanus polymorphus]